MLPRPHFPVTTTGGPLQSTGRAALAHRPGAHARALPGAAVRTGVTRLVTQRELLLRTGRGHIGAEALRMPLIRLRTWLQHSYDHMPHAVLARFWHQHEMDLRLAAPATRGGRRDLDRLQHLCAPCATPSHSPAPNAASPATPAA